jgi:hypothetical protein
MGPQKNQQQQRRQLVLPISEENAIEYQKLDPEIRRKARELLKLLLGECVVGAERTKEADDE